MSLYPRFFSFVKPRRYRIVLATVTAISGCAAVLTLNHVQFTLMDLYPNPTSFLLNNTQLIFPVIAAVAVAIFPRFLPATIGGNGSPSSTPLDEALYGTPENQEQNKSGSRLRKILNLGKMKGITKGKFRDGRGDAPAISQTVAPELQNTAQDGAGNNSQNSSLSALMNKEKGDKDSSGEGVSKRSDPVNGAAAISGSASSQGSSTTKQGTNAAGPGAGGTTTTTAGQGSSSGGDQQATSKGSEAVNSKIENISEEIEKTKTEFGTLKEEMSGLKSEIQNITSAFESSLVELKAFQAEMVNPMNFMRQYFDTLEIKQLSDPVKTLRPPESSSPPGNAESRPNNPVPSPIAPPQTPPAQIAATSSGRSSQNVHASENERPGRQEHRKSASIEFEDDDVDVDDYESSAVQQARLKEALSAATSGRSNSSKHSKKGSIEIENTTTLANTRPSDISSLLMSTDMSPSRMMSIVEIVDEILAAMGPEGVNMLVEQYKHLGLTKEDELVIYNVMKMLNESKMMTDDVIAMFYRFGQVLGINDKEAELHYMRLIANKKQRRASVSKADSRRE